MAYPVDRPKIMKSYAALIEKTSDRETLIEIGRQIFRDDRISLKDRGSPFHLLMDKLEAMPKEPEFHPMDLDRRPAP